MNTGSFSSILGVGGKADDLVLQKNCCGIQRGKNWPRKGCFGSYNDDNDDNNDMGVTGWRGE
jgi:hypothetical protein